jgi:hypothetical protein
MLTSNRSEQRMGSMAQHAVETTVVTPTPSWKGLYRARGVSAILYILLALAAPAVLIATMTYDFTMDGTALLSFIAAHRLWWIVLQTLVLETSILAIVAFVALYTALKGVNKSYAAIGAIVAGSAQLLFMAYYPVLLGLVYLSDQYIAAPETQRAALAAAADALIAQNNAFNPFYEPLFAAGVLILSLVMLKGVFHKGVAYLGIATFAACLIGMALWPFGGASSREWVWLQRRRYLPTHSITGAERVGHLSIGSVGLQDGGQDNLGSHDLRLRAGIGANQAPEIHNLVVG